ncbi:DUF1648 domain-containing protein [Alkalicoccobacillus gibsonii]|uniref:DUF1648 domain-containing protein n=1 Tax=Alkalicoccobacillus gibsonii TaxID=79881 RepID=UPI001933ABB3|nr:DUF5808 domain-containing protein [Alkalicoccobacillus gibsonii]MBM0065492.1 DUF1648 domain-containing protein [Alkalicoccobacillus gibsonii]
MTSSTLIAMLSLIFLPIALILASTPYLTRKTESFGVSIPESVYGENQLQNMRRRYAQCMVILSVILMGGFTGGVLMLSLHEETIGIFFAVAIILFVIGAFFVYLKFHRDMKELKKNANWARERAQKIVVRTDFRSERITYSNMWYIVPVLMVLLTTVLTAIFYDRLPALLPLQVNFAGEVTHAVEKSYRAAFFMPIMQSYLIILFLFINVVIAKAKQQLQADDPEKSFQQIRAFRKTWSLFLLLSTILLTIMFSFIQWTYFYPVDYTIVLVVTLSVTAVILIGALWLAFKTGQGGSRVHTDHSAQTDHIDRDNDRYWKLGQIYVNPNDPSLFLEKRFGVGWTVNFARPVAWLLLAGVVITAIGIPMLLTM